MNEGDEEQLTLKLISKLESLEAENTRLRRERELALSQNDFLSSKISTMDSALENAVAEITNLEERSNIFQHSNNNSESITNMPTPKLHHLDESYTELISMDDLITDQSLSQSPAHPLPPPKAASIPSPSPHKPWASNGIKNDLKNYMTDMQHNVEELETQNANLKDLYLHSLANANVNANANANATANAHTYRIDDEDTVIFETLRNKTLALTANHNLLAQDELETEKRNFLNYKKETVAKFEAFEKRLGVVLNDLQVTNLEITELKKTNCALKEVARKLESENARKKEAVKRQVVFAGKLAEGFRRAKAEEERLGVEVLRLREIKGSICEEREKKFLLQTQCRELVGIVEVQNEMIDNLKKRSAATSRVKRMDAPIVEPKSSPAAIEPPVIQPPIITISTAREDLKKEVRAAAIFARRVSALPV